MRVYEGVNLLFCEPEPEDKCEYSLHQKIKGRWGMHPCGDPAFIVAKFGDHNNKEYALKLCEICVARVSKELVSIIAYGVSELKSKKGS